ncbi:hypothetical protein PENANT_c347G02489 [Penicillium antarcticum]|uniref:DUF659 domain-containing protein n=1 Tax=Penicillium antarcticum TaxID=416450 RepID=A0A1V6NPJ8_9EURO|nr:hypothetical protein PENANT_c347G02489 [Penicillium antarcticum]
MASSAPSIPEIPSARTIRRHLQETVKERYFIDLQWNYREILLGFEPLRGSYTGAYLSSILLKLLEKHQITNRVLTITTDNASNNGS